MSAYIHSVMGLIGLTCRPLLFCWTQSSPHICVAKLGRHWFRKWLVACLTPSHYLNQWCLCINHTPMNKLQSENYRNKPVFINEIVLKFIICNLLPFYSGEDALTTAHCQILEGSVLNRSPALWKWCCCLCVEPSSTDPIHKTPQYCALCL